jgi:ABC-2 type transport system permease protein
MSAIAPIVDVTARGLFGRRRILLLILLAALPVLIALLIRVTGGRPDPDRVLDTLVVRFVMPLIALIVGTTVLGSEIDDGTAVYLLVKPVSRWRIVLAKAIVAAGLTAVLIVPAVIVTSVLLSRGDLSTLVTAFTVACLVGGSAYAIAFLALSAFTSRAFLIGLAYVLIWEGVLAGLLEGTKFLSIRQATLGVTAALGIDLPGDQLAATVSALVLAVVIVGGFVLGSWRLARFEIRGGD